MKPFAKQSCSSLTKSNLKECWVAAGPAADKATARPHHALHSLQEQLPHPAVACLRGWERMFVQRMQGGQGDANGEAGATAAAEVACEHRVDRVKVCAEQGLGRWRAAGEAGTPA
jgi:hypothetical protein